MAWVDVEDIFLNHVGTFNVLHQSLPLPLGFTESYSCLREAKALYSCEAEHSHELSFPQGALFSNGK